MPHHIQSSMIVKILTGITLISVIICGIIIGSLDTQIIQLRTAGLSNVDVKPFTFLREDGITLDGNVYFPKDLTLNGIYPAVFLQHGVGGRKENMESMAISFADRGFVVVSMDMRNHYGSAGYNSFGMEESNDLIAVSNSLNSIVADHNITIGKIGLVGHSLGALTVSLAAIKGHFNSCVAIAPVANISALIQSFTGAPFQEFQSLLGSGYTFNNWSNQDFINNITLTVYSAPSNYLIIGGYQDETVQLPILNNLLQVYTHNPNAQYYTQYGSFATNTALEMDVFNVTDHDSEQYAFDTPIITIDAINWTEHALNVTWAGTPIVLPAQISDFQQGANLWNIVSNQVFWAFAVSLCFLFAFVGALVCNNLDRVEKDSVRPNISANVALKTEFQNFRKSPNIIFFLICSIGGTAVGAIIPWPATQFLMLAPFFLVLIPIIFGLILASIATFLLNRKKGPPSNDISPTHPMQITRMLIGVGIGFFLAYFFTTFVAQLSNSVAKEFWIKPLPNISGIEVNLVAFVGICSISEAIMNRMITRSLVSLKGHLILPMIIIPLFFLLLGLVAVIIEPIRSVSIAIQGISLWIPGIFAILIGILMFFFEIINLPFRKSVHTGVVGPLFGSIFIGWILLSSIIAI